MLSRSCCWFIHAADLCFLMRIMAVQGKCGRNSIPRGLSLLSHLNNVQNVVSEISTSLYSLLLFSSSCVIPWPVILSHSTFSLRLSVDSEHVHSICWNIMVIRALYFMSISSLFIFCHFLTNDIYSMNKRMSVKMFLKYLCLGWIMWKLLAEEHFCHVGCAVRTH